MINYATYMKKAQLISDRAEEVKAGIIEIFDNLDTKSIAGDMEALKKTLINACDRRIISGNTKSE